MFSIGFGLILYKIVSALIIATIITSLVNALAGRRIVLYRYAFIGSLLLSLLM